MTVQQMKAVQFYPNMLRDIKILLSYAKRTWDKDRRETEGLVWLSENTSNSLMLMITCILTLYRYYMKQRKGQRPIL